MNNLKEKEKKNGKPDISVKVNNVDVVFEVNKATGSQIKSTAISQGVDIQQDFNLFEKVGNSGNLKVIKDDQIVTLHPNQKFRAVAPDDNSQR